ncbi:MAG: glutamate 5-kinase [Clostridiales bacterium]|nr:glutamate 5-kinase [Candidatus Scatonaster coprocaballi]
MSEEEKQGRNLVTNAHRIVVKVGTSTLTYGNGRMNMRNMDRLARAIADLMNSGREVVLVTSGAIGVGVGCLDLPERPSEMRDKQAVAAVGQCELMNVYSRCFAEYSRVVAQILLTKDGIDDPRTRANISNTMESLLEKGILPIVNENDTVSTAEIPHAGTFGDNDTLSALVARVVNADLLIILSDIDAVYDSNPRENPDAKRISVVTEVDEALIQGAGGAGSALGTGGMSTKITAMSMLMRHGIAGVIAEGSQSQILEEILEGDDIGTLFVPSVAKEPAWTN